MNSRFFVAPLWRWFMGVGFVGGVLGGLSLLRGGQYHSLAVAGAFLLYCTVFLVRYSLHPYIKVSSREIRWILPPFFWEKRLSIQRVVELYGEGDTALLLLTRDGGEIKIPLGFLRRRERRAVKGALQEALGKRAVERDHAS